MSVQPPPIDPDAKFAAVGASPQVRRASVAFLDQTTMNGRSAAPPMNLVPHWSAVTDPKPPEWLIRQTIPLWGVSCLAGQSGMGKTYALIDMAYCVAGNLHWAGRPVMQGGVLILAAEGAGEMEIRMEAAKRAKYRDLYKENGLDADDAAIAWVEFPGFPALTEDAADSVALGIKPIAEQMKRRYGLPLRAVFLDTMIAAGLVPPDKENDAGTMSLAVRLMKRIGAAIESAMIPLHHYGKSNEAGLRGSSTLRADFEAVVAFTGHRDELTGKTTNRNCAQTKCRGGPEGPIGPFSLDLVQLGQYPDGAPYSSNVLTVSVAANARTGPGRKPGMGRGAIALRGAVHEVLSSSSSAKKQRALGKHDAPELWTAPLELVKPEFQKRYATGDSDPDDQAESLNKAWKRALDGAASSGEFTTGSWSDREWIWSLEAQERASMEGGN